MKTSERRENGPLVEGELDRNWQKENFKKKRENGPFVEGKLQKDRNWQKENFRKRNWRKENFRKTGIGRRKTSKRRENGPLVG